MSCLHCQGEFTATDRDSRFHVPENRSGGLLQAVETLLEISSPAVAARPR